MFYFVIAKRRKALWQSIPIIVIAKRRKALWQSILILIHGITTSQINLLLVMTGGGERDYHASLVMTAYTYFLFCHCDIFYIVIAKRRKALWQSIPIIIIAKRRKALWQSILILIHGITTSQINLLLVMTGGVKEITTLRS